MRINESDIRTIVAESVRLILEDVSDNLEVFYDRSARKPTDFRRGMKADRLAT
jgi:hypothetical protein